MSPAPHIAWLPAIFFSTACTAPSPSTSPVSCWVGGIATHPPLANSCTPRRQPRRTDSRYVRACVECSRHVAGGSSRGVGRRDGGARPLRTTHCATLGRRFRFAHRGGDRHRCPRLAHGVRLSGPAVEERPGGRVVGLHCRQEAAN